MKSKRIRELQQLILSKSAEMETALTGETKDIAKAESLNDEITGFEREINVLNAAISREKAAVPDEPVQKQKTESIEKAFADAARSGFRTKAMNETTGADGGYTVPEDIQTRIEQFRDAKFSLRQLVAVENVTTKSGRRTFKKRAQQTGFAKVAEGGKMTRKASPQFQIMEYTIEKYMGYLPVTNELLADSDANITNTIVEWLGDEARAEAVFNEIGDSIESMNVRIQGHDAETGKIIERFAALFAMTNNEKPAIIFPSALSSTANAQYTTVLHHVAFGDSETITTTTTFTPEAGQQNCLVPFATNANIGDTSYTPYAYYIAMGTNYAMGFGKFEMGDSVYISNGYWAIMEGS